MSAPQSSEGQPLARNARAGRRTGTRLAARMCAWARRRFVSPRSTKSWIHSHNTQVPQRKKGTIGKREETRFFTESPLHFCEDKRKSASEKARSKRLSPSLAHFGSRLALLGRLLDRRGLQNAEAEQSAGRENCRPRPVEETKGTGPTSFGLLTALVDLVDVLVAGAGALRSWMGGAERK